MQLDWPLATKLELGKKTRIKWVDNLSLLTVLSNWSQWMEWSVEGHNDGISSSGSFSARFAIGRRQDNQSELEPTSVVWYVVYTANVWSRIGSRFPQRLSRTRQRIHVHRIESEHRLSIQSKSWPHTHFLLVDETLLHDRSSGLSGNGTGQSIQSAFISLGWRESQSVRLGLAVIDCITSCAAVVTAHPQLTIAPLERKTFSQLSFIHFVMDELVESNRAIHLTSIPIWF